MQDKVWVSVSMRRKTITRAHTALLMVPHTALLMAPHTVCSKVLGECVYEGCWEGEPHKAPHTTFMRSAICVLSLDIRNTMSILGDVLSSRM